MKKSIAIATFGTILGLGTAGAATTLIDLMLSWGGEGTDTTSSQGTIVTSAGAFDSATASRVFTYTVSDLTLDPYGVGDDAITFKMKLTGASGTGSVTDIPASYRAWGVNTGSGDPSGTLVNAAREEALTFSYEGATVTLGSGATDPGDIVFNGLTSFQCLNLVTSEAFDILGTSGSDQSSITGHGNYYVHTLLKPEDKFTLRVTSGGIRYRHIKTSVTVETVPEPSAPAALLGLLSLGLLARRRK